MGCGGCNNSVVVHTTVPAAQDEGCRAISAETLRMYRRPIACVLEKGLVAQSGIHQDDLVAGLQVLNEYISLKDVNPNDCTYHDRLPFIQQLVRLIIEKSICI